MLKWFADCRKTYNLALHFALTKGWHDHDSLPGKKLAMLEKELLRAFVPESALADTKYKYLLRTPKTFRHEAVKELVSNFKTFQTNVKKRLFLREKYPLTKKFQAHLKFHIKPKTKHMLMDSISCDQQDIKPVTKKQFTTPDEYVAEHSWSFRLFPRQNVYKHHPDHDASLSPMAKVMLSHGGGQEKVGPVVHQFFNHGKKIHYRYGLFYVIYPRHEVTVHLPSRGHVAPTHSICAIDPGVRKPFTIYSPDGHAEFIGTNATQVLDRHIRRVRRTKSRFTAFTDSYVAQKNAAPDRPSRRAIRASCLKLRRTYHRAEDKLRNVIKHFHYNVAHTLLSRYRTIIFPTFNGHSCMSGNLRAGVKLRLQALRFGSFKRRLSEVASGYPGAKIVTGSEAYTSKQCGTCGALNDKLGSSEVFKCKVAECGNISDRDLHAARNILLRFLLTV